MAYGYGFIRPGTCSVLRRSRWRRMGCASSYQAITSDGPTRPSAAYVPVACDVFITEATFGLPVFHHPDPMDETEKLLASLRQFPERTHLIGAVRARQGATCHPAVARCRLGQADLYPRRAGDDCAAIMPGRGLRLASCYLQPIESRDQSIFKGAVVAGPPSAFSDRWARRFRRSSACLCVGLDDGASARQATRRRATARHFGSLRLAGAD